MSVFPTVRVIPADVRQIIDRTDDKMDLMIAALAIIGDQQAEQITLLIEQNKLLRKQMQR